eukprot:CAMPEP_0172580342 /NCGR_PEP_ID=MMETSP1067-20121228/139709_1 /TAXON_ID=265564 ORGANISM="Thalassiosira punctigera, Strain Tpunct2005C2" /NCGR_SAMPLE_ID=MMETSP1067 /ASSEMBLY_ACC=CAM_ASM_000444 /LENGTH=776 /DNA_ID=CAMNT_0013373081 /DNA_START=48 /DNA_END=2374 /DNA_ORIENTATION=+
MPNDLGPTAGEACASVVNHYSDPIHYALLSEQSDADDIGQQINRKHARNNGRSAPYFDPNLGQPMPDLAPVCEFWYQRLLEVGSSPTAIAQEWLHCYKSQIHPLMRRKNSAIDINDEDKKVERDVPFHATIEILSNYEILLAHFMRDASKESVAVTCNPNEEICERAGDEGSRVLGTCELVYVIADDIFQWSTRLPNKDKRALWRAKNVLLPCLLRLIEHSVVLIGSCSQGRTNSISFNTQFREGLAIATVAAISFIGDGRLNSGDFGIGSLLDWIFESINEYGHVEIPIPSILSLAHTLQSCSLSPVSKPKESNELPESIVSSSFMTRPVVDWSVQSAHFDAPWTDGVSGVGSRVGMGLIRIIHQSSSRVLSSTVEEIVAHTCPGNRSHSLRLILRGISENIGVDLLVSTVRAHFFGRLMHSCSCVDNAIVQTQVSGIFMPMVKRIGSAHHERTAASTALSDEKPHIDIPMRISAAAIILCAALPQPCNNFEMQNKAFSDSVPIAMSLLDDAQPFHQAMGALMFVSVIEAASSSEPEGIPSFVKNFSSITPSLLGSSIQMCARESPPVLTCISLAQSKWIKYLGIYSRIPGTAISPSEVLVMARKAVADILVVIRTQAQTGGHGSNDERIAGALVAGINPLLAHLASFPEAESVEIARIGLSTFLPLIGWSGMRLEVRSAQVSALVGLISLMNGAYPIMPHHGKKIMTEVFLLLDRADKDAAFLGKNKTDLINGNTLDDRISTDATIEVALHAASLALIICGKSAQDVLGHIEAT